MTPLACAGTPSSPPVAMRDGRTTRMSSLPERRLEDRQYAMMELAYGRKGGLSSGDGIARLLRSHSSQPLSLLARWIVDRQIVSFRWRSLLLVPKFQFEPAGMRPRPTVLDVVNELAPYRDDWDLACWFAQPNARLEHRAPLDLIDDDPEAVRRAARADRQGNEARGA